MSEIKISPTGNLLMYRSDYTPEFVKKTIQKKHLNGLKIFADLEADQVKNFKFLTEYDFLEGLEIASRDDYDYKFLKSLKHLKYLNIQNQGASLIDLSSQINLETLSLQWRSSIVGVENCKNLSKLYLVDFKEKNLDFIKNVNSLTELQILSSTIVELTGIENCNLLKNIKLGNCKQLTSIMYMNGLINLKELSIDSCSEIQDWNLITNLPNLESLQLINCKGIPSIKFVDNFPKMSKLVMLGNTNILDSNLMPANKIEEVIYTHKKHYNVKIKNKKHEELKKRNLERIKNTFNL